MGPFDSEDIIAQQKAEKVLRRFRRKGVSALRVADASQTLLQGPAVSPLPFWLTHDMNG
jgi:hypothetical protein